MVVVLPAPFGPRRPNNSPSFILRSMWLTATSSSFFGLTLRKKCFRPLPFVLAFFSNTFVRFFVSFCI